MLNQNGFTLIFILLGVLILGFFAGVIYFVITQKSTELSTKYPDAPSSLPIQSEVPNKNSNESELNNNFDFQTIDKYRYEATLKDVQTSKIIKQRIIDLSKLGWDVTLIGSESNDDKKIYYDTQSEKIIIPLTVVAEGIGGEKLEGTLPDPPFITAVYITTFQKDELFTKIYDSNDFQATHSIYDNQKGDLYFTENTYDNELDIEIIWAINIESQKISKLAEIKLKSLSMSGTIFNNLEIINNKIVQILEPNSGEVRRQTNKKVTVDLDTRKVQIEDI